MNSRCTFRQELHPQEDLDRAWERAYPGREAADRNATLRRLFGQEVLRLCVVSTCEPEITNVHVEADKSVLGGELQALEGEDEVASSHVGSELFGLNRAAFGVGAGGRGGLGHADLSIGPQCGFDVGIGLTVGIQLDPPTMAKNPAFGPRDRLLRPTSIGKI